MSLKRGPILAALGLAAAILTGGASAWAADVLPAVVMSPVVVPVAAPANGPVGQVELFGAFAHQTLGATEEGCTGCHQNGPGFGGLGRAGFMLGDTMSLQLDAWAEHLSGDIHFEDFECFEEEDCNWAVNRSGIAAHLTYNGGALQAGILASIGARSAETFAFGGPYQTGSFANLALEAVYMTDRFRLYAQAGITTAVGPAEFREFWRAFETRSYYARLTGTYYAGTNLAISANVGFERLRTGGELAARGVTWGLEGEYLLPQMPLFVLASYQGASNRNLSDGEAHSTEHVFRIGLGILVGAGDLQTRDRRSGLADYNGVFGTGQAGLGLFSYATPSAPPPPP